VTQSPDSSPACTGQEAYRQRLDAAITRTMDNAKLDALVYPTWSNPPRLIGDLRSPAGDNNQFYSPSSGFPAITVPAGFISGLPVGVSFFGRAWSEPVLLKIAYGFERATTARKPPQFLATDHGVPPREMRNRNLPAVWVRHHEQYFKNTTLRHQIPDASYEYAARDLFQEVQEPARKRGATSARILP